MVYQEAKAKRRNLIKRIQVSQTYPVIVKSELEKRAYKQGI